MRREEAIALKDKLIADMGRVGTLQVHLYAGPGVGKSTTRALVFGELKRRGREVEDVPEYAKQLVYEGAQGKLAYQPLIAGKQLWKMRSLEGKVEAIITDTSSLFSVIYGGPENGVTDAFRAWLIDDYRSRNTLDFFLERDMNAVYNPNGRTQKSIPEALAADQQIKDLLNEVGKPYKTIQMRFSSRDEREHNEHIIDIADDVERVLDLYTDSGLRLAQQRFTDLEAQRKIDREDDFASVLALFQ